jgi:hypothetical protein
LLDAHGRLSPRPVLPIIPFAHLVYRGFSRLMPEGDQRVFADPEIQAMFIDDIVRVLAGKAPCQAVVDDKVSVRWWHGDADSLVSYSDAQIAASHLPMSNSY